GFIDDSQLPALPGPTYASRRPDVIAPIQNISDRTASLFAFGDGGILSIKGSRNTRVFSICNAMMASAMNTILIEKSRFASLLVAWIVTRITPVIVITQKPAHT